MELLANIHRKISLLLLASAALLMPAKIIAQQDNKSNATTPTNWTLEVKGVVTENDKKLPGAVVTVYQGGNVVNTINTSDGKFNFQLQPDNDYVISFSKPGYITKRISFSTKNITPERGKFGFTPFTIDQVDIFPEIPGTDIDQILQQPVAKIEYNPKYHNGDFDFDDRYTQSIQALLDKILAAKRALDAQYKSDITKADGEFKRQEYTTAKADYTAALKLKPNEQYPKDQLDAIEKALKDAKDKQDENAKKLAEQGAKQAKYDSIVKIADAAFAGKDYKSAKTAYNNALEIFPDKKYPKDQLKAIDNALANQDMNGKKAAKQAQYDSLVKIADAAFAAKDYKNAKPAYSSAAQIFPEKRYPKDQLKAIDAALAAQGESDKRAANQAKYDSIIKIADAAYAAKKYDDAKAAYRSASNAMPKSKYPKDQLRAIDAAVATEGAAAKKAAAQAKYDSIIKIADAAYTAKKYDAAKAAYTSASGVMPKATYPKTQLALIDKATAKQPEKKPAAPKKNVNAEYDSIIKLADAAFNAKKYDDAKTQYLAAQSVKPTMPYPKKQLAAIDRISNVKKPAPKKNTNVQYDSVLKLADAAFRAKKYDDAKTQYLAAQSYKPTMPYPKQQLAAIERINNIKKPSAKKNPNAQYDSILRLADAAFRARKYEDAKPLYTSAQSLKPTMPYPKQQLAAIDRLSKQQKKPTTKKDTIAKVKDTAKKIEVSNVQVCPCEIKKLTDSCRGKLKPFLYNGTNALHIPLNDGGQEKEISLPGFSGQRYRIIINISSMPPGTVAAVYDQDNTHKKRKLLYNLSDGGTRTGFVDAECKGGKFYVDYVIPGKSKGGPPQGCAVILFGYESR